MLSLTAFFIILLWLGALMCGWWLCFSKTKNLADYPLLDTESNAVHLVMNAGMAMMLMPLHHFDVHFWIVCAYTAAAVVLVAKLLWWFFRRSNRNAPGMGGTIYHLVALLAMIYAGLAGGDHSSSMVMADHAGHHGMASPSLEPNWEMIALGVVFLLDGIAFAVLICAFPSLVIKTAKAQFESKNGFSTNALNTNVSINRLRVGTIPHLIMDAGMVYMLWVPSSMHVMS